MDWFTTSFNDALCEYLWIMPHNPATALFFPMNSYAYVMQCGKFHGLFIYQAIFFTVYAVHYFTFRLLHVSYAQYLTTNSKHCRISVWNAVCRSDPVVIALCCTDGRSENDILANMVYTCAHWVVSLEICLVFALTDGFVLILWLLMFAVSIKTLLRQPSVRYWVFNCHNFMDLVLYLKQLIYCFWNIFLCVIAYMNVDFNM